MGLINSHNSLERVPIAMTFFLPLYLLRVIKNSMLVWKMALGGGATSHVLKGLD